MRKTFALDNYLRLVAMLKSGELQADPLVVLCELMGHADIRATLKYVPRTDVSKQMLQEMGADWGIDFDEV
ncbi:hypothetical protein BVY04_03935 [bacterium M21]|nr:hypothetical protein BVY04_03935 [bacterium M21]